MMFSIYNLTDTPIEARNSNDVNSVQAQGVLVRPSKSTLISRFHGRHIYLNTATPSGDEASAGKRFQASLPGLWAKRGASWRVVSVVDECPWRVYWFWPARALVVLPRRNMASFLSDMPDSLSLASLTLPGTHDTMAFYGWPVSQCQSSSTPLSAQFLQGVRVIDIRLAVVPVITTTHTKLRGDAIASETPLLPNPQFKLIAYHGIYPQRTPFSTILSSIHTFLTSPAGSKETLVMSIKQEDFTSTSLVLFSRLVKEEIMNSPGGFSDTDPTTGHRSLGIWFLQNRIPTLGEVRGKVVLLSRFGGNGAEWEDGLEGLGIHPQQWPDSEKRGFVWHLKGVQIRTHDWYAIPSFLAIPEKATLSTLVLLPAVPFPLKFPLLPGPPDAAGSGSGDGPAIDGGAGDSEKEEDSSSETKLNITYLSAATIPLALPQTIAKGAGWPGFNLGFEGVNARVGRWLLEELVPDLKAFSPIKSADAPESVEIGYGAVKQEFKVAALEKVLVERKKGLRWFRHSNANQNGGLIATVADDSRSHLLQQEQSLENGVVHSPLADSSKLRGWVLMDFYSSEKALVPLLVEFNYRARQSGQEGWP